jgi:hypothetical protein
MFRVSIDLASAFKTTAAHHAARSSGIRRAQRNLGIVRNRKASGFNEDVKHTNEPLFSCLHEFGTNRVSNQARGRVYVKLAHSGCSMRLCRFYAEI